jgi:hypothetical protein
MEYKDILMTGPRWRDPSEDWQYHSPEVPALVAALHADIGSGIYVNKLPAPVRGHWDGNNPVDYLAIRDTFYTACNVHNAETTRLDSMFYTDAAAAFGLTTYHAHMWKAEAFKQIHKQLRKQKVDPLDVPRSSWHHLVVECYEWCTRRYWFC